MADETITGTMIDHYVKVVQTQHGIVHVAEEMAKVLAEMGRASCLATGDSPAVAIYRWSDLIRKRACELVREKKEPDVCGLPKPPKRLPSTGT